MMEFAEKKKKITPFLVLLRKWDFMLAKLCAWLELVLTVMEPVSGMCLGGWRYMENGSAERTSLHEIGEGKHGGLV